MQEFPETNPPPPQVGDESQYPYEDYLTFNQAIEVLGLAMPASDEARSPYSKKILCTN